MYLYMKNPLDEAVYRERTSAKYHEDPDPRGVFFRDQTKIIHSMPFRRLKKKTQVFFSPQNDHICTRIEHVIHVATIATTICRGLNQSGDNWKLNEDMAYAIGLGHDLGHAPFGHAGETALKEKIGKELHHEIQGYRIVENIYKLNLTYGVKDGIISHNGEQFEQEIKPSKERNNFESISKSNTLNITPSSYEGCIVRFADKIAYLGRDLEDAIKGKFVLKSKIPDKVRGELSYKDGKFSNSSIINNLIIDIIENSKDGDTIKFSNEKFEALKELKKFNYDYIYYHEALSKYKKHVNKMISALYDYLFELYQKYKNDYECYKELGGMAKSFGGFLEKNRDIYEQEQDMPITLLVDYISGMTDDYALQCVKEISLPAPLSFDEENVLR